MADRLRPGIGGKATVAPQSTGVWSLLDGFVNSDNALIHAASNMLLPGGQAEVDVAKKGVDYAGKGVAFALGQSSTPLSAGPAALEANVKGAPIRTSDLNAYTQKAAAQNPMGVSGPVAPIVGGMWASEKIWDYGVNRPISTAALLAKKDSPLYNGKPITAVDENGNVTVTHNERGFQLGDVVTAFNQSEKVSAGQALAASDITKIPFIGGALPLFNMLGGVDKYDPWDDRSMQAAQDNPFYVAATGGTDLALQIVVPPALRAGRIMGMRKVGLTNTITSVDDLNAMRAAFDSHTPENPNPYGQQVHDIAAETNSAKIRQKAAVANSDGADKLLLSDILAETSDPSTVNEILLANRGDVQALVNLNHAAPDIVWRAGDVDTLVRTNAVNGVPFRPIGPQLDRVNQVFDSALARNRYFTDIRNLTTQIVEDPITGVSRTVPTVGSTWKPTNSMIVETVRNKGREIGYAIRSGDYSDAPQWVQNRVEGIGGKFVTTRVQWAGSRSPLGHVSLSGARPEEKVAELTAQMDTVPFLRGTNTVVWRGQEMRVSEFRQTMERYLLSKDDAALPDAWAEVEDIIVELASQHYDVSPQVAAKLAEGFRGQVSSAMQYMRDSGGYLFDELADKGVGRVLVDAQTQRQMLSSFQTLPMAEVIRTIKDEGGGLTQIADSGQDFAIHAFDTVQKVFRTDVLFRPGYTGKNSVLEPLMSRYIVHGTILADEGLWATVGNFTKNTIRRFQRVGYIARVHKMIDRTLQTKELRAEVKDLVSERYALQTTIDNALSELDHFNSPDTAPSLKELHTDEVRGILVDSQMRMDAVEAALDGKIPEWRQIVEPATQSDIRAKLLEFSAITGDNPGYVDMLNDQASEIVMRARARVRSPQEQAQYVIDSLQQQLDQLTAHQQYLSEDYAPNSGYDYTGHSVAADGKQIATGDLGQPGDVARGRDIQAAANKRQLESLQKQIDDARVAHASASTEPDITYTPNEKAELARINGILDRIDAHSGDPAKVDAIRSEVEALQKQYDALVAARQSFRPTEHLSAIQDLQELAAALDHRLGEVKGDLSVREGRWREIGANLGQKGYSGSGTKDMVVNIGGERFEVPAAFSQREYTYGEGYRSEASAQTTNQLTYDPSRRADYETGRWRRSAGADVINPDSPLYWDELAHTVNRFFRSDRMIQKHLSGWSRERIALWLQTDEGQVYQKGMGKDFLTPVESYDRLATRHAVVDAPVESTPDVTNIRGRGAGPTRAAEPTQPKVKAPKRALADSGTPSTLDPFSGRDGSVGAPQAPTHVLSSSTTELDRILRIVDQYLPDKAVQRAVADAEPSAGELQAAMGARDDLSRITGDDLNFHPSRKDRVTDALSASLDRVWHWIATMPEDRIARWPFYQHEFRKQIEQRGKILHEQGVRMTPEQWAALRQSAHRESIKELEKTFYNIRRYSTPVYASRFLITFPGAFANSLYRWGRFAVKEPERVMQLGLLGGDILHRGGIDENGNPTKNLLDIKYLLIPGTKSDDSPGVRIPVSAFSSLAVDYPSLSIGVITAASIFQRVDVRTAGVIQKAIGDGAFTQMFPYGVSDNPASGLLGGYQRDLWRAGRGIDDVDVQRAAVNAYAYNMYEWERNGAEGDMPTMDEAVDQAAAYYATNALIKWVSPFAVNRSPAGKLMETAWSDIEKQYGADTEAARVQFVKQYGDAARWLTYTSNNRTAYVPPTTEAHTLIWNDHPELAKKLVEKNPDDPSYVSLLAYGVHGQYNQYVADALQREPLPGDKEPAVSQMDPVEYNAKAMETMGWDQYGSGKTKYDAEHLRLSTMRDNSTSEFERQHFRDLINGLEQSWSGWVGQLEKANEPWAIQRAGKGGGDPATKASIYLNDILSDSNFMSTRGKDPAWQKVQIFLQQRDVAKEAFAAATSDQERKALKGSFTDYVTKNFASNDPDFTGLWDRYFASEWDTANG